MADYNLAVLYNGLGRYEEALAAARRCCEYEDLGFYGWCLFELVEAAAHAGDTATAAAAVTLLGSRGRQRNTLGRRRGRGGSGPGGRRRRCR